MKIQSLLLLTLMSLLGLRAFAQQIPNRQTQIDQAVLAAPEGERAGATVLGYDQLGNLIVLRQGSGNQICLADDPNRPSFSVACYYKDLEPFMARGRQLRAQGKSAEEVFDTREAEAKSGKLKMPDHPSTLHIYFGSDVDHAVYRWVIYIPWATSESTGLPKQPIVPGGPWIMNPGTHKAHIMVSPPQDTP